MSIHDGTAPWEGHGKGQPVQAKALKVDFTAMWQGVGNAFDANEITEKYYDELFAAVRSVAYPGKVGRLIINYTDLLIALAAHQPDNWSQAAKLWRRLGDSLASGVSVASEE